MSFIVKRKQLKRNVVLEPDCISWLGGAVLKCHIQDSAIQMTEK